VGGILWNGKDYEQSTVEVRRATVHMTAPTSHLTMDDTSVSSSETLALNYQSTPHHFPHYCNENLKSYRKTIFSYTAKIIEDSSLLGHNSMLACKWQHFGGA
jgi:hypothetical protein